MYADLTPLMKQWGPVPQPAGEFDPRGDRGRPCLHDGRERDGRERHPLPQGLVPRSGHLQRARRARAALRLDVGGTSGASRSS
jgi:hypothetical protein